MAKDTEAISRLEQEFYDHMQACGVCPGLWFQRCWIMNDICEKLVRAGIFKEID